MMQPTHLSYLQPLTSDFEESLLVASSMVSLSIRETDLNKAVWNHRFNLFTRSSGLSCTYIDQVPENLLTMYLDHSYPNPIKVTANVSRHTITPNLWHPDTTMLPLFCMLVQDTHPVSKLTHCQLTHAAKTYHVYLQPYGIKPQDKGVSFQNHKTSIKYIIPTAHSHGTYTIKFASKDGPGLLCQPIDAATGYIHTYIIPTACSHETKSNLPRNTLPDSVNLLVQQQGKTLTKTHYLKYIIYTLNLETAYRSTCCINPLYTDLLMSTSSTSQQDSQGG